MCVGEVMHESGWLIHAKPPTNSDFKHAVLAENKYYKGLRVSLTFRNVKENSK